ncbi:MAG: hypothetical protein OXE57_19335 [Alphaproteobacteria bacterium]|nr:hypothetical protein [Alphaproteobacteria bacterium]
MTPELIAILAVGVALAGLMLRNHQGLGKRMDGLEHRFDNRMDGLDKRIDGLDKRMDRLDQRIDGLEQRFDNRMDGFDDRLRASEVAQADLKGSILGKLDLIERYIIARNLLGDDPAPQTGGADE